MEEDEEKHKRQMMLGDDLSKIKPETISCINEYFIREIDFLVINFSTFI